MIGVQVNGIANVQRNLARAAAAVKPGSLAAVEKAGLFMEASLKRNRFSSPSRSLDALRVGAMQRTGRSSAGGHLRATIHSQAKMVSGSAQAHVGTPIFYAAVHESGCIIVPKRAAYLRFKVEGHWVSTKRVVLPARRMFEKERAARQAQIQKIVGEETVKTVVRIGNGG